MRLLTCDNCGDSFYEDQGYIVRDDETVCSICIDEEELMADRDPVKEQELTRQMIDALAKEHAWEMPT